MHPHVVRAIKARRAFEQTIRLRRPARRLRRPLPRAQQPDHLRLAYFAALRRLVLIPAKRLIQERIVSELPSIVSSAGIVKRRSDKDLEDVDGIMEGVSEDFFDGVHVGRMADIAAQYAAATSDFQKEQLGRQLEAAVGVQVPLSDGKLKPLADAFTQTNVALIKSIPQRYFQQIQSTLMVGVSAGKRWEEIADDLEERYEVSESTARLIARDQVGKFFGSLNRARQEDLGINRFIWRTVKDNRVREAHRKLEGQSFSWDELPENDDGEEIEPGLEVNCRCWADPDVLSVVESLEEDQDEAA